MRNITAKLLLFSFLFFFFSSLKAQSKSKIKLETKVEIKQSHFKKGSDIKIIFTVTNNSEKEAKFCSWQSPIEKSFTSDFFEIKLVGKTISYSGKKIKRSPQKKSDYLVIKPQQSIKEEISLKDGYILDQKGTYTLIFKGSEINNLPNSNQIEIVID
jgi:hypothetical protein